MQNVNETRVLGRQLGRTLTVEELQNVSGGMMARATKCEGTICDKNGCSTDTGPDDDSTCDP